MAKVHNWMEMWQGSENLRATRKESRAHNKHMTAIGYILDMAEIVQASCRLFQHDGAAAFTLLERSPLPPACSAKDLPGGRIEILNVRQIRTMDRHPAESDEDTAPESISNTENWLDWNGDLDNPNLSEDDREADDQSDTELDNGIEDLESREHLVMCATPIVPGLTWPTWRSTNQAPKGLTTVTEMETRSNTGSKRSRKESVNIFSPGSICCLTEILTWSNIMSEYWAVACGYLFINRCIVGEMNHSAIFVNFGRMRETHARILLDSALPKGWVSLWQKVNQYVKIIIHTIMDGSRYWPDNILKRVSTEHERCLVL